MEFYEAINKRKTTREFLEKCVDFEAIKRILEAGNKAPTWNHNRNWQFIVLRTDEEKEYAFSEAKAIADKFDADRYLNMPRPYPITLGQKMYGYAMPRQYTMLKEAPYVIIPLFKSKELNGEYVSKLNPFATIWCVIENIFLAATAEGLSCSMRIPLNKEHDTLWEMEMIIKEIEAKSVITKSNLPVCDFSVNPYTGCEHACKYCYACFMKRFTNHPEEWGEFVDVKIWQPIKNPGKYKGKELFIGSVTDPYQPVEEKYRRTRTLLKELQGSGAKLSIATKSSNRSYWEALDTELQKHAAETGIDYVTNDDSMRRPFDDPPVIVNYFYHEKIKKSA